MMDRERQTVSERPRRVFPSPRSWVTVLFVLVLVLFLGGGGLYPSVFVLRGRAMFSFAQPVSSGNKEKLSGAEAWRPTPSLSRYVLSGWLNAVLFTSSSH